jgi:sugar phosphate isomerase/epimerase
MQAELTKSYKGRFSFRLGTTSFVFPEGYAANVRRLGAHIEEVELLLFESHAPECFPSAAEIRELGQLASAHGLTYCVHLPYDVDPAASDSSSRRHALEVLKHAIRLTRPLAPRTYVLHAVCPPACRRATKRRRWRERLRTGLAQLLETGVPAREIAIENLHYPFEWVEDIVRDLGFSVCLDVGHLILGRWKVATHYDRLSDIVALVHLHGVCNGHDHLPLDRLTEENWQEICHVLARYRGAVVLEVFRCEDLLRSLAVLEDRQAEFTGTRDGPPAGAGGAASF